MARLHIAIQGHVHVSKRNRWVMVEMVVEEYQQFARDHHKTFVEKMHTARIPKYLVRAVEFHLQTVLQSAISYYPVNIQDNN
jgi:hypothetical protein